MAILGVQFLRMVIHPRIYEYVRYSVSLTISLMCYTESIDDVLNGILHLVLHLHFTAMKTLILIPKRSRSRLAGIVEV